MQIITPTTTISSTSTLSASTFVEPTDPSVGISISADHESHEVLISLTPPKQPISSSDYTAQRASLDICCVIDVSGSMSSEAPIQGDPTTGGQLEKTGLSVLDVVKHSIRTIMATMKEGKHD